MQGDVVDPSEHADLPIISLFISFGPRRAGVKYRRSKEGRGRALPFVVIRIV